MAEAPLEILNDDIRIWIFVDVKIETGRCYLCNHNLKYQHNFIHPETGNMYSLGCCCLHRLLSAHPKTASLVKAMATSKAMIQAEQRKKTHRSCKTCQSSFPIKSYPKNALRCKRCARHWPCCGELTVDHLAATTSLVCAACVADPIIPIICVVCRNTVQARTSRGLPRCETCHSFDAKRRCAMCDEQIILDLPVDVLLCERCIASPNELRKCPVCDESRKFNKTAPRSRCSICVARGDIRASCRDCGAVFELKLSQQKWRTRCQTCYFAAQSSVACMKCGGPFRRAPEEKWRTLCRRCYRRR